MVAYTVDSTKAGTSLVSAAGTITDITIAALPTTTDKDTQITLTDGLGGRPLWAATIAALAFLWEPRMVGASGGVPLTPGLTVPALPRSLLGIIDIPFTTGIYVKSCPTGISLTVTA
jgi:hypothetical protein